MTSLIKGRLQGARRVVVGPPLCGEMKRPEKNQKGGPLLPICLQSVSSFVAVPPPFHFLVKPLESRLTYKIRQVPGLQPYILTGAKILRVLHLVN